MADAVALTSVVSSALVAIGGLVVSYRSGREQRSHEAQLAFEARAWETKSQALFGVIAACRQLVDAITNPRSDLQRSRAAIAYEARSTLDAAVPAVETYASQECRDAFHHLRGLLSDAKPPSQSEEWKEREQVQAQETELHMRMASVSAMLSTRGAEATPDLQLEMEALKAKQADLSRRAVLLAIRAQQRLDVQPEPVRKQAEVLIATARASLRG